MFSKRAANRGVQPSLIALAVAAAVTAPARADGIPVSAVAPIQATQTFFPAPGAADAERANSQAVIGQIRADYAYLNGISGRGVTIATLDTGISAGNREFSEALKIAQGYNVIANSTDVTDRMGHGTHVAGILAAGRDGSGIFGVAYDAQLLPIKVLADDGSGSTTYLDKGLRYAIGRAPIVNMSLGAAGYYDPAAMKEAVGAGLLIVAAAGNDGAANPAWPARFAKESWANNQIIAVGAVDGSNQIAAFSNRAGDTAAWFLVAPGVHIMSSYLNGQYVYMSGTSMATPAVSGAAALLKQIWPTLQADQIANILFMTATDLGAPGIDPIYGRGLLNVEKALQPIGPVTTTTFNGRTINVLDAALRPSSATSKLWSLAASGSLKVLGVDSFQRDFSVDLGAKVAQPAGLSLDQAFGGMDRRIEVADSVLANGASLLVAYERRLPMTGAYQERAPGTRLAAFSMVAKNANGREAAWGAGGMAADYFGLGGLAMAGGMSLATVPALSHPYFTLLPGASHLALSQTVGGGGGAGGLRFKFGVLSTGFNHMLASQQGPLGQEGPWLPSASWTMPKANAALMEVSKSFGNLALAMSFSQTREGNGWLGAQSTGALAIGPRATTSAVQFAGALLLTPKLALAGQASYGYTPGSVGDSLISELTATRTNAFSLALVASDRLKTGDRLSFAVSQPLRTYAGQITMDMLTAAQTRERVQFSMVPTGRELRTELNYQAPAGRNASAAITLVLRQEPNNMAEMPMEKLVALRYTKQF